jgi:segregation and condensation protein B
VDKEEWAMVEPEPGPRDVQEEEDQDEISEVSLEDLGAAYARVAAEHDPNAFVPPEESASDESDAASAIDGEPVGASPSDQEIVTPEAIIEGALFVGHPQNKSLSEQRLASLMRDVKPEEVEELIERLNQSYLEANQALRIVRDESGYRMTITREVESIRRSFYGKVREAKLNQAAIEVLSLVAYQPGITAQTVQDQRGRESNALLNQLVRRQLLRIERRQPDEGGRKIPHYYPTDRFLELFGLESLEDLPQVEEGVKEG